MLLTEHYDPRYEHAMGKYSYLRTVDCTDLDTAAKELDEIWHNLAKTAATDPAGTLGAAPVMVEKELVVPGQ